MAKINTHLHQYISTVTGSRVVWYGYFSSHSPSFPNGYFVFKCKQCGENWNVGAHLFDMNTAVPIELDDWLKSHKHVCTQFISLALTAPDVRCVSCGWAYHMHKEAQPQYDQENGVWVDCHGSWVTKTGEVVAPKQQPCIVCGTVGTFPLCPACVETAKRAKEIKTAVASQATEGRMFRQNGQNGQNQNQNQNQNKEE